MVVTPRTMHERKTYASLPSQFPNTQPRLAGTYSKIGSENSGLFKDLLRNVSAIIPNKRTETQSNMVSICVGLACPVPSNKMSILKWLPLVLLAGCQEPMPTGQVVATLPNAEITVRELEHEERLSGQTTDRVALESVIDRKVLAQEAVALGLDIEEDFHFELRKSREDLLIKNLKERIAERMPSMLENEVWIEINRQPWRYKDRLRLYLTRNEENGERTVFWIDTADYNQELPEEVYTVEPGDVLTLKGRDWNVHLKEALVASPEEMMQAARDDIRARQVADEIDLIIKNYRQTGQTVYKEGYGPAAAVPSKVNQKNKVRLGADYE